MSVHVDGTKITMTRGDTLRVTVTMELDGEPYVPETGDTIRFALKHAKMNTAKTAYKDDEPLIEVTIPNDTLLLEIPSNATRGLPFGDYVYDIQITYTDGTVDTFIPTATLILTPEVD